jgi:hypothetical protein
MLMLVVDPSNPAGACLACTRRLSILTALILITVCSGCHRSVEDYTFDAAGEKVALTVVSETRSRPIQVEPVVSEVDATEVFGLEHLGSDQLSVDFSRELRRFYLADRETSALYVLDPDGSILATTSAYGTGPGELREPADIAVSADGMVYVADSGNYRISVFDADLEYQRSVTVDNRPVRVDVDSIGNIYVVYGMPVGPVVHRFSAVGEYEFSFADRRPAYLRRISELTTGACDICVDGDDNIWLLYNHYYLLRCYSSSGQQLQALEILTPLDELSLSELNDGGNRRRFITSSVEFQSGKLIIPLVGPLPDGRDARYSIDVIRPERAEATRFFHDALAYVAHAVPDGTTVHLFDVAWVRAAFSVDIEQ